MENRMYKPHLIAEVEVDSIAFDLEIKPGDQLLTINGLDIADVFDYRVQIHQVNILVLFALANGELLEAEIEKEEEEDLGLIFDQPLLDNVKSCKNDCVFCFVDQLPKGMRSSLYFRDDDLRLSFLQGNYVTLTNLSEEEFERFLSYRLSPLNISVHATKLEVRQMMVRSRVEDRLMERLKKIVDRNILLNCQIVLCPELNDGDILEQTLQDLMKLGDSILSIAVVPVGLTKYRTDKQLFPLQEYSRGKANQVLGQTQRWQQTFLDKWGRRVLYAADEFFIKAQVDIPEESYYEDFPQLENGVGLVRHHCTALEKGILEHEAVANLPVMPEKSLMVALVCGVDAKAHLNIFAQRLSLLYNIRIVVHPVVNEFFGDSITVSGLLVGEDICRSVIRHQQQAGKSQVKSSSLYDGIILPDCCLKQGEEIFLDDMTLAVLKEKLHLPVYVASSCDDGLLKTLDEIMIHIKETK